MNKNRDEMNTLQEISFSGGSATDHSMAEGLQLGASEICLVLFQQPNSKFSGTFSELICALSTVLRGFGVRVSHQTNRIQPDTLNLVFGWHSAFKTAPARAGKLPPNSVVINLEPLSGLHRAPWLPDYIKALSRQPVVDYSFHNVRLLQQMGNSHVHRFRYGYIPLSRFTFPKRQRRLVFYGSVTKYRKPILQKLRAAGWPVQILFNCWGAERDLYLGTAAAVLNIGKMADNILEVLRLWHCLSLGVPVISERGVDRELTAEWQRYVSFVDSFDELIPVCPLKIIDPLLYRRETSMVTEAGRLLEWIADLKRVGRLG